MNAGIESTADIEDVVNQTNVDNVIEEGVFSAMMIMSQLDARFPDGIPPNKTLYATVDVRALAGLSMSILGAIERYDMELMKCLADTAQGRITEMQAEAALFHAIPAGEA